MLWPYALLGLGCNRQTASAASGRDARRCWSLAPGRRRGPALEPPDADPNLRWRGNREGAATDDPILLLCFSCAEKARNDGLSGF